LFKPLETVLRAKSIALVGASERARWPTTIYNNLKQYGYAGKIFPINPARETVWGLRCYASLDKLPEPVDHACLIVPAAAVVDVAETAAAVGITSATVYAASVGDGTVPASHKRGRLLKEICDRTGLIVAGPNCMGAMSWREKLFLYPNENVAKFEPGSVGVVFQSGGSLQGWLESTGARGARFSYAMSSGNELNVDLADYLNFLVEDPDTKVIVAFIEGIRRVDAFKDVAARALVAGKPIIAIKTGRTQNSREAAESHTGAIGGDWKAFAAMCERYGVIVSPTLDDMTETVLAFQQPRLPKGPRLGLITTSGGSVDLLYDYAEDLKANFPEFAPKTIKRVRPFIQEEVSIKNPLDCGIPQTSQIQADFCQAVLDDPSIDMIAFAAKPTRLPPDDAQPLKEMAAKAKKPVLGFERMRYPMTDAGVANQANLGVPFLMGLPETVRAMNALAFYGARVGKKPRLPGKPKGKAAALNGKAFDKLLAGKNVTLPKSAFVTSATEAAKAARKIGFPIALKVVAPKFSHKTEVGGVLLGLTSADDVAKGVKTLEKRIKAVDRRAVIDGYLLQEMVSGVEMIVGCREDPIYGPIILLGAGGILVELIQDVAMRMLPIKAADVKAMLDELTSRKLLDGFRGTGPADVAALVKAVVGLGEIFLEHRHLLADLEVNPLIVRPKGKGVAAVDVLPIRRAQK
jgi:acyl-CoA synthetase (NDP forming)